MGRNDSQGFFRRGKKQLIMNSKTLFPLHNRWSYRMRILSLVLMLGLFCAGNSYGIGKDKKVEQYEKSVKDLFVDDRWEEGMKILREGLRLYPESSELNGLAGSYYYQLKDYDNARYYLVRAVKDTPDNVNAKSLLVNVEEETGNYSSAICYVNELLEVTPYWPGLWKRKIGLYRRQGNNIEADRLLKRLVQIYPNDTTIRQDYLDRLEENYLRERKAGDKVAAIEALQELLANDKSQEVYYLDLTNLLLQQGSPESALQVASEGVISFPTSIPLISKKAEILSGLCRYPEALAFLENRMSVIPNNASLQKLYNAIMGEYARSQQSAEPYQLYGRLYALEKDPDALNYLIDESIRSGREEDMKKYLAEARRMYGDLPELRYKEYDFYKRQGSPKAVSLLEELYDRYPDNSDIVEEFCALKYAQAEDLRADGSYTEAVKWFMFVSQTTRDTTLKVSALKKAYAVNLFLKQYDAAGDVLESLNRYIGHEEYVVRKAEILNERGDVSAALDYLYDYWQHPDPQSDRAYVATIYEETALPYIKQLMESGDLRQAGSESRRLLEVQPLSETGVQYAIASYDRLGDQAMSDHYLQYGLQQFPWHTYFIEKKAGLLYADKQYQEAIDLLRPVADSLPGNQNIVSSLSASSEANAYNLIKLRQYDEAMASIDTALVYDRNNHRLYYAKGVIYEKQGLYDSAYVYQSQYKPDITEARDFKRHLIALERREMKNELSMGIIFGGYLNGRSIAPVMDVGYAYTYKKNQFFFNPAYTAREDLVDESGVNVPGGQAVRLVAGWGRRLSSRLSSALYVGWSNEFFPTLSVDVSVGYDLKRDWNLNFSAGYRSLNQDQIDYRWEETTDPESGVTEGMWVPENNGRKKETLLNVGVAATKSYEFLILTLKGDFFCHG